MKDQSTFAESTKILENSPRALEKMSCYNHNDVANCHRATVS